MKLGLALLIICLIAATFAASVKEETTQLVEPTSELEYKKNMDVSILETVKYIKSRQFARSLQEDAGSLTEEVDRRSIYQTFIWVPIILILALFYAVMSIFYMDLNKENDTMIYAKFLTTEKAKK